MYSFTPFTDELIQQTRDYWCQQAKEHPAEVMVSVYERLFDWVAKLISNDDSNTHAYVLAREASPNEPCAIVELSHARPDSTAPWLKVLSIHIEPRLEVAASKGENLQELAHVVAYAVVESLGLTFQEYPSTQLKVYASTPLTISFLEGVAGFIDLDDVDSLRVSAQGNWLVIDKI